MPRPVSLTAQVSETSRGGACRETRQNAARKRKRPGLAVGAFTSNGWVGQFLDDPGNSGGLIRAFGDTQLAVLSPLDEGGRTLSAYQSKGWEFRDRQTLTQIARHFSGSSRVPAQVRAVSGTQPRDTTSR
jgi:hypothetical protein